MEIVERDVTSVVARAPSISTDGGFPEVTKVQTVTAARPHGGKKRQSLFAREAERMKQNRAGSITVSATRTGESSAMVDGSGLGSVEEAARIHQENSARLAAMSEEEVLQSQQEVVAGLDPGLVAFLRNRARTAASPAAEVGSAPPPPGAPTSADAEGMDDVTATSKLDSSRLAKSVRFAPAGESTAVDAGEAGEGRQNVEKTTPAQRNEDEDMEKLEEVKDQLPIDLEEARGWPHMDRVEPQKLLWMTQLPPPKVDHPDTGFSARFDFQGELLPFAADPPAQSALYHHGAEPERAGYTVDEIFRLIRSSVLQQRSLGLNTLANLLRKVQEGRYDGALEPPLTARLLDAGLLLLLRFALDDAAEPVLSPALSALEALLQSPADEVCLDRVFGWSRGLEQPSLPTSVDTEPEKRAEYQQEEPGLKDDDVTRLDAVRGLIRIGTLGRIRYVLEVVRPPPPAVLSSLRVVTRCARHSLQAAVLVAECPRLLETVVSQFLPVCGAAPLEGVESVRSLRSVYGVPLHPALRLVRVLCSRSAQLASRLVRKHPMMQALLSYVAINPSESGMPCQEVLTLAIEAYRLWTVLLNYGLGDQHFIEFFPLLMRQLHFYLSVVTVSTSADEHRFNHDLGTCLIGLCRAAVCAAWSNHQTALLNRTGADMTLPGALRWGHVTGLLEPVQQCTHKWLSEIRAAPSPPPTDNVLQLLGGCCQFLTAFHERWGRLGLDDTVPRLDALQRLSDVTLLPFMTSEVLRTLCGRLVEFSSLLSGAGSGRRRDPDSLPSVAAVVWQSGQVAPVLRPGSPLPLLTPLLQLLRACCRLHRSLQPELCAPLVRDEACTSYLRALAYDSPLSLVGDWFTRHEVHLATELTLLHAQQGSETPLLCHAAGLRLMQCFQTGDEHLCAEVMRHVVFNPSLLTGVPADNPPLARLVASCSLYERCLLSPAAAAAARDRADALAGRVSSLTTRDAGATLLPVDWWYAPLVQLHDTHVTDGAERAACIQGVEAAEAVARCLHLLQMLFTLQPAVTQAVSATSHFARLCCVFLAGDALFLDADVKSSLAAVLRHVLQRPDQLDLTADIPGLASFGDLYLQLLEQFEAVSYGDWLFGAVLLVPLQPRHPPEHRRTVWLQKPLLLRSITTAPEQMLVPLEVYLAAPETDPELRAAYQRAISRGQVHPTRNPALHRIATALSS